MMVGVMWMFQVIAFILVALRLYTRLVVMHIYGIDDHFFNFTVVSTSLLYETFPMTRLFPRCCYGRLVHTLATKLLRSTG